MNDRKDISEDSMDDEIADTEPTTAEAGTEPSMEALLEQQASFHDRLEKREVVWVKVVHVQSDQVQVDVGEKQDGQIAVSEFAGEDLPKVGARIPVVLTSHGRREDRAAQLSYRKARFQLGWDQVLKAYDAKSRVRGTVTSAVKGGFLVDVSGVSGFLPSSLADLRPVRKPEAMLRTGVRCYIIEVNKDKKQIVLSRKAVLEEEVKKRRDEFLSKVKVGDVIVGRVHHAASAGVFVRLGGVDGFVPTAELAWKEPEKVKAGISQNQKLKVKILKIEPETGKITLGVKQFCPNPADFLKKKYPPKTTLKGKVIQVHPNGIRVEIGPQMTAFCSIEELARRQESSKERKGSRGRDLSGQVPRVRSLTPPAVTADQVIWPVVGDPVKVIVLGVNYSTFEVTASIRRFEEMEDRKRVAQYLKGSPRLTLGQILTSEEDQ